MIFLDLCDIDFTVKLGLILNCSEGPKIIRIVRLLNRFSQTFIPISIQLLSHKEFASFTLWVLYLLTFTQLATEVIQLKRSAFNKLAVILKINENL